MIGNYKEFLNKYKPNENEYIKNNMLYCKNCNDEKIVVVNENEFYVCSSCSCTSKEYELQEEQRKKEQRFRYIESLKMDSLLYDNLKNLKFKDIDTKRPESFLQALKLATEFCKNYKTNIQNGVGLYLYGDTGLGKTMLAACIANFCLNRLMPTLFTSLYEIKRTLLSIINGYSKLDQDAYIEKLSNIDLLIIDDIGTELKSKNNDFINDIVFQILDKRVKSAKSTIFTSNYGLNELVNKGLEKKNAERILELCKKNFVQLLGTSYRLNFTK